MNKRDLNADLAICNAAAENSCTECGRTFIAEARNGWSHAIERALEAELEVESLRTRLMAAERELPAARALLIGMRERAEKAEAENASLRTFNQTLLQREGQSNGRLLMRIRELESEVQRYRTGLITIRTRGDGVSPHSIAGAMAQIAESVLLKAVVPDERA